VRTIDREKIHESILSHIAETTRVYYRAYVRFVYATNGEHALLHLVKGRNMKASLHYLTLRWHHSVVPQMLESEYAPSAILHAPHGSGIISPLPEPTPPAVYRFLNRRNKIHVLLKDFQRHCCCGSCCGICCGCGCCCGCCCD
jgi:hypothetical protein